MCFSVSKVGLIVILFVICIAMDLISCRRYHGHRHKHHKKRIDNAWDEYKSRFNKMYTYREDINRKSIFKSNLDEIAKHNKLYEEGLVSYKMDINEFGDMSEDEFLNIYAIHNRDNRRHKDGPGKYFNAAEDHNRHITKRSSEYNSVSKEAPSHVDWREEGAVTPVLNQGHCGSCYAFTAVGAIEAQYFLKGHKLTSFSVQNILDCSLRAGNRGCHGGHAKYAFKYLMNRKYQVGLQSAEEYDYLGFRYMCLYNIEGYRYYYTSGPVVKGYEILPVSEEALKQAVASHGPVAVEIDPAGLRLYSDDEYYNENCNSDLNQVKYVHAVLVVGYGTDEKRGDYWILKNSWGKDWGDNGYFKLARNRNNQCGVASKATIVHLYD